MGQDQELDWIGRLVNSIGGFWLLDVETTQVLSNPMGETFELVFWRWRSIYFTWILFIFLNAICMSIFLLNTSRSTWYNTCIYLLVVTAGGFRIKKAFLMDSFSTLFLG